MRNVIVQSMRLLCTAASEPGASSSVHKGRGAFVSFKNPVYRGPEVNPLEEGPDFSFVDGRPVHVTTKKQLDAKLDQLRLAKRVISLLGEVRDMEDIHKSAEKLRQKQTSENMERRPIAKGKKAIM